MMGCPKRLFYVDERTVENENYFLLILFKYSKMGDAENFIYDNEENLIEDKHLQGEAAKMHLCIFIAELQRIVRRAIPSP